MIFSVGCTRCSSSCLPRPETSGRRYPRKYDFCVTRVGFLGPHGTFAEEAVLTQPDLADQELHPRRAVPDVIAATERDQVDIGLVPLETAIDGTGTATRDTLACDTDPLRQPENETRFVLVGHGIPAPTGHDKTSVVCFQREDRPGSLLAILQEFAARAINLTKLESRPTKRSLGDYCFFIDFNGHIADELVADCLRNLAAKQAEVKFLGSYPVAGEEDARQRREAAGKAWRQAAQWVDDLRRRVAPPGETT